MDSNTSNLGRLASDAQYVQPTRPAPPGIISFQNTQPVKKGLLSRLFGRGGKKSKKSKKSRKSRKTRRRRRRM
uniref:Uncharacterized protein n=1 Tax=viral metagenome TaxID=1070528 RepID=A0A6C0DG69_9ZZZZ